MDEYFITFKRFLFLNSQLLYLATDMEKDNLHSEKELSSLISEVEENKERLLHLKENLELVGGLDFLLDANFVGFSIQNGMLTGDVTAAITWALGILDKDPASDIFYYEVASYIMSLVTLYLERREPDADATAA